MFVSSNTWKTPEDPTVSIGNFSDQLTPFELIITFFLAKKLVLSNGENSFGLVDGFR